MMAQMLSQRRTSDLWGVYAPLSIRRDYWRDIAFTPKYNLRGDAHLLIARTI